MVRDWMVGLMLFLTTASAWAGTYFDNFDAYEEQSIDDGNMGDWRRHRFGDQTSQWRVKAGELVIISKNICVIASPITIGDTSWANYEVEVQFRIVETFITECKNSMLGFGVHVDDAVSDNGVFFRLGQ